jgi:hypothetical protein
LTPDPATTQAHFKEMAEKVRDPEFSDNKIMRWLGFIQGALVANFVYSLEEVKEHSRTKKVSPPADG